MEIYTDPAQLAPHVTGGCTATIGNFDGVHKGHQALIATTVTKARALGVPAVVITFTPHPLQVLLKDNAPPTLMALDIKLQKLEELGVDITLVLPFTSALAKQTPEEFVQHVLVNQLHLRFLAVGYDYAFGKNRRGTAAVLASLGQEHGFAVEQLAAVPVNGTIVSSTAIREALRLGRVETAEALLGHPHLIRGEVVHGKGRGGSQLGFPTANLAPREDTLLPAEGVYAVYARVRTAAGTAPPPWHQALASVGTNPTFQDGSLRAEIHLLDFDQDLYGKTLEVAFVAFLRAQKTCSGITELVTMIQQDVRDARQYLGKQKHCPTACPATPRNNKEFS